MPQQPINPPLPANFQLEDYRIERQLSLGGFSIVYLAHDAQDMPVAIKEYLPARLARRIGDNPVPVVEAEHQAAFNQGMQSFFEEGRILASLDHPNVVRVLNFFRANQTAYLVMRYERGRTLQEHIQKHRGELGESFIREVFVRLLNGLREVHMHKLLHLDIKPANIYLRSDGHPVLLDFGATRQGLGEGGLSFSAVHTRGFAAPEQMLPGEAQGPWTDIYAVGATLYACLAKGAPLSADLRMQKDELEPAQQRWRKKYSPQMLELIDWCMQLPTGMRPQSVFALQKVLNGELLDLVDPAWFEKPAPAKPAEPS
ncbi:MAG: serine/threonine protein kinase [Betaproteobacteria bacterium]|nr:serine/threonine protein kinase [Betaproteobacteria bacterium]